MKTRPRVAFVIHRYTAEPGGGLERLCQLAAWRMSRYWKVAILTTCASDFSTWKNEFAAGPDEINGLGVNRFPVDYERDPLSFKQLCDRVLLGSHTEEEEEEWMRAQGPYSTLLFDHIRERSAEYDLFIFFGYLYATTYFGIPTVKDKAVLVPAAHDEPMIRLGMYRSVFTAARYILWLTPEEQRLIQRLFGENLPGEVCGSGLGPLSLESLDNVDIKDPYLLYVGRIDHPKGCGELLHYFVHSTQQLPHLDLYLVGQQMMKIPGNPRIRHLGWLDERKKNWLLAHAVALVMPSHYESLSLVLLESWYFATPVLVNGHCQVLKGQCIRSGGGLLYMDHLSFIEATRSLALSPGRRATLGLRGLRYAQQVYKWTKIEQSYLRAFQTVCN